MSDIQDQDDIESDDAPEVSEDDDSGDGASPAPINPDVAAYLQSKNQGQAGLAAAQAQASRNRYIAGMGRAASTLAQSAYGHTAPVDNSAFDDFDKAADAPVQNFQSQQKEATADPTSPQSKAVQGMISKLYPGKFTPDQLSAVSADDAEGLIYKPLELDEKIKEKQQEHADTASDRSDRAETKVTDAQAKAYTSMRKDLESFRGNQSMQQAALAVQNSDKALALAQATPTPQNLNLLADEMGKIATGGVPGEQGTKALLPDNLYTKVAQMKAWVTGHPNASAADVSEYLQNNKDYINQVRSIAGQALNSYRTNISKGYKHRVAPDDYQEAVDDYGLGGSPTQNAPQTTPAVSSGPVAQPHPQDSVAVQWAKNNPGDPRAQKILKLNGVQ